MKTLIVLTIGIMIGYYFNAQNIDSISDIAILIENFLQTLVNKLGEYND
jgi:hypothetical protein